MKIKKMLALLTLILVIPSLQSCNSIRKAFETGLSADVEYREFEKYCSAYELTKKGREKEVVYVLDEYRGKPVTALGDTGLYTKNASFGSEILKKIYFPWSISYMFKGCYHGVVVEYVISASNTIIPSYSRYTNTYCNEGIYDDLFFVIPLYAYEAIRHNYRLD